MELAIWILGYLLFGFVLQFAATAFRGETPNWRWDLVATLAWPFAIVAGICNVQRPDRKSRT